MRKPGLGYLLQQWRAAERVGALSAIHQLGPEVCRQHRCTSSSSQGETVPAPGPYHLVRGGGGYEPMPDIAFYRVRPLASSQAKVFHNPFQKELSIPETEPEAFCMQGRCSATQPTSTWYSPMHTHPARGKLACQGRAGFLYLPDILVFPLPSLSLFRNKSRVCAAYLERSSQASLPHCVSPPMPYTLCSCVCPPPPRCW
ncbi:UNVERIFIED_CONTAM: hypothetical protein K2H54_050631 [Gekko kuhli]